MVITNDSLVSNCTQYVWPFPSECPPKPWTPKEQRDYEQQQRAKVPDAPMIVSFV